MTERDPRVSPVVGDAICRGIKQARDGVILREVTRAHGGFVFFASDNGYVANPKIVTLEDWRQWARNAEVITRGDQSGRKS